MACVRRTPGKSGAQGQGQSSELCDLRAFSLDWEQPRRYRHFDLPINEAFPQKVTIPTFVSHHSFSPLIHYLKSEKRYKKCLKTGTRKIEIKPRPIKYASHRDACILGYYAHQVNNLLDAKYDELGIGESIIAYRSLGRSNYDFAAEALAFANSNAPVSILAFDVTSFFDTLDHSLLKKRLKNLLGVNEIPDDWYKVFRFITRFHFVDLDELRKHPAFGPRLKAKTLDRIASIEELKTHGITFHPNPDVKKGHGRGIPQGTPISATASNLYMIEFDTAAKAACDTIGAFYRRYSDDILIICKPDDTAAIETTISNLIAAEKLQIAAHKTEKTLFVDALAAPKTGKAAQYLGFNLAEAGATIRQSSLSRQWRKMRRAMRRAKKSSEWRMKAGAPNKIHTKKLYKRFSYIKIDDGKTTWSVRNFSSYGRRSAAKFDAGEKILKQVKRFERAALRELAAIKELNSSPASKTVP